MFLSQQGKFDYIKFQSIKNFQIIPGSCLEGNFVRLPGLPAPHIEDRQIVGEMHEVDSASAAEFEQVLEKSSFTTVESAFGMLPQNRLYPPATPPPMSIITLKLTSPSTQFNLKVDRFNELKLKADVFDANGYMLSWLPVTDLGFCDHIASIRKTDPQLSQLNAFINSQRIVYLRIGLSRRFFADHDRDGYWLQLNGIYSFPNFRQDLRIYDW